MHLSTREIFHSYENLESFPHFLAFLINYLYEEQKKVGLFGQVSG